MAIEKTIDINVNSKNAQKGLNDLEKSIDSVNKEVKETNASTQAMSGTVDKATGGAISKFNALKGTLGTVIASFKSLRIAIIGTGIGALVIAITSLGQAFTRSEEGQNKFAKILGVIGSVTGNLLDLLADLGEGIISVFEDPKQALIDFKNLIVENITNRFKAILDTVGFLGSAIKNVFSGDFKAALNDAKKAGSSFVDSFTGVENSIDKATNAVKDFNKEIVADAKAAAKIADQRARAEKLARDLVVERAKADRDIAELREKAADKENFTAQERIEFLKAAGAISEDIANKETEVARLRLEAKQTENALTKSTKEDLDEEAQLKADLINKDTQRLKLQKALTAEITTATREANKTTKEGADKDVMTEEQKQDAIEKIQQDYIKKKEDRDANTELKKIELEEQRKLAELERLNATETQKMEVEAYYNQLRDEVRAAQNAKQLEETKKLNEELAQAEVNLQQAKANAIQGGLQVIGMLAGKSKGVAKTLLVVEKGLAIAQVISNAARAIAQAKANLAATPAVIGLVPNPAYLIQAAATAKGIVSTKLTAATSIATIAAQAVAGLGGGGGGGGSSVSGLGGGSEATQSQAPSFNIVGATETSQLADAVAGQTQQPVQAYVVANDVTTAQSLENNIVQGATL